MLIGQSFLAERNLNAQLNRKMTFENYFCDAIENARHGRLNTGNVIMATSFHRCFEF